ncbi:serine protease, partial [Lentzea flava]
TQGRDTGTKCVLVLVDMKLDKQLLGKDDLIPARIGQVPTDVVEIGVVQAGAGPALTTPSPAELVEMLAWDSQHHPAGEDMTLTPVQRDHVTAWARAARAHAGLPATGAGPMSAARLRPAVGDLSIGHYRGTAGTLGICCTDAPAIAVGGMNGRTPTMMMPAQSRRFYVLSNNHVLANCNDAAIGDPILQPAPADGGTHHSDTLARLARFVPIKFGTDRTTMPINMVDAAIAETRFDQVDRRVHWIGEPRHTNPAPMIGQALQASGRASHYSTSRVVAVNATVIVHYPGGRTARFAKQILSPAMTTAGDSGALGLDTERRPVGLLFAHSPRVSVFNPVPLIEQMLGICITDP